MIIDVATLTGAARAALGTEIPALFSLNTDTGNAVMQTSLEAQDPLWQLPLWEGYERYLKSPVADITNSPNYGYAGSITAALFLKRFVTNTREWLHLDTMAWNVDAQPGRPVGGEALGLRALYQFIRERFAVS
jgi:leucyl aminopeptidase